MTDRTFRALTLGFLASTAIVSPAWAQTQPQTTGQSPAPAPQDNGVDQSEIIITATKREENLQNVPIAVTVLGTRKLDQLNISNFEEYTKQLPSVSFQTAAPIGPSTIDLSNFLVGTPDSATERYVLGRER